MFHKYLHIEKFNTDEVDGIELGEVFVFPKLDGTNGSVWREDDGTICAGSRNRLLSIEKDNHGFLSYVMENKNIQSYLEKHPTHRLFGEWLVPHSLKTYRDDTWRKFYIFDITISKHDGEGGIEYIPYEIYHTMLDEFQLDYVPPICIIKNGNYDKFIFQLEKNVFLIEDGKGTGEGIVIKNYSFYNKYHRQTWAKIVKSEFKELHTRTMGAPVMKGETMVEDNIVDGFCTLALIEKTHAKIVNDVGGWNSKLIPRLLNTVYHDLIVEDIWQVLKKFKSPIINFRLLNTLVIRKIKEQKPEIFC